jgi:hypothetical protein
MCACYGEKRHETGLLEDGRQLARTTLVPRGGWPARRTASTATIYAGVDFLTSRVAKLGMVLSGRTKQVGLKVEVQHEQTDTT